MPENNKKETETQTIGERMMDSASKAADSISSFMGAKTEETKEEIEAEKNKSYRDSEIEKAQDSLSMTDSARHLINAGTAETDAVVNEASAEKESVKAEHEKENMKEMAESGGKSITETLSGYVEATTNYLTGENNPDTEEAHREAKEDAKEVAKDDSKDLSERASAAAESGKEAALESAHMLE
eukprot:CAMPEP_0117080486 /NCGR_PEP_ID=MMETSP0472-20121206/56782_1 /TAXON_ID=693140 ORGANISM="Tiarina fusus, Strain LIS" /NCGR_SAMPLE_ID=MMETSP0472 /ASSEMBLY_ACC=CAM_ASM_000603 /LENGTH=183 /DNA_ID=CAMNT_0004808135 /DNA_START=11 /DNA_END=562 /DNA_ORIENTATION=+